MHNRRFLSFHALGSNTGTPRIFLENHRLIDLGFSPDTPFQVTPYADRVVIKKTAESSNGAAAKNHVSVRRGTTPIPILDVSGHANLAPLLSFQRVKVAGYSGNLVITPSIQAFNITRSLHSRSFRVLECAAGGGTMHTAMKRAGGFEVVGANELSPRFANEYGRNAPDTELIIGDMRFIHHDEYPQFDILVSGFPCSPYSKLRRNLRRAKGSRIGAEADVIIPLLSLIASRMPVAIVFENVPAFATSPFAELTRQYLQNLGYHLHEQMLHSPDFADIQDRTRWCMISTLRPGFGITVPHTTCTTPAGAFLDQAADRDQADAARIASTVRCLDRRIEAHRKVGNKFGYTVIDRNSTNVPILTKNMHKINQGPFVPTQFGLRMPRKAELERISGHSVASASYPLTCQIIGQGVSVPTFAEVFRQLHTFLLQS